ncbi:hypothetical protein TPS_00592 [Trichinella pseudospiralis]
MPLPRAFVISIHIRLLALFCAEQLEKSESNILELVCLKPAPLKSYSALRYFIIQCIKNFNEEAYSSQIMAEKSI